MPAMYRDYWVKQKALLFILGTDPLIAIADTMLAQIPSSFRDMSTGRKNLSIGRKNAVTG
jgi:hypothetical protein